MAECSVTISIGSIFLKMKTPAAATATPIWSLTTNGSIVTDPNRVEETPSVTPAAQRLRKFPHLITPTSCHGQSDPNFLTRTFHDSQDLGPMDDRGQRI